MKSTPDHPVTDKAGKQYAIVQREDPHRGIPVYVAEKVPGSAHAWRFWCPHCRYFHTHGSIDEKGLQHRIAHCATPQGGDAHPEGYFITTKANAAKLAKWGGR